MSLLWRDAFTPAAAYTAVVAPQRVLLVRRRRFGGRGGAADLQLDAPWVGTPVAAAQALAQLLQGPQVGAGTLQILVSSHFVRYLLVPWRAEVATPEEFAAYARICCEQTFGGVGSGAGTGTGEGSGAEVGAGQSLRTAPEKPGSPRLAAAMDTALVQALVQAVGATRLRLVGVQPYLAAAFNRLSRQMPREDFIFVVAEPGRSCLLAASQGQWRSVRASACEDAPERIAGLIEREAQLLGLAEDEMPPVFVHAPRQPGQALPACHGRVPATLDLPGPRALAAAFAQPADALRTMALAGA